MIVWFLLYFPGKIEFLKERARSVSKKTAGDLGIWGCCKPPSGYRAEPCWGTRGKAPRNFFNMFWTTETSFAFSVFNCFIQHIALVNTFLTSVGRLFGYSFRLSFYMFYFICYFIWSSYISLFTNFQKLL